MQDGQIVADKPTQQSKQVADLRRRPRPVFGTERENRQIANAEFAGGTNDITQGLDATAMAFHAWKTAGRGPSAVPVHDDRHMQRTTPSIRSFSRRRCGIRHQSIPQGMISANGGFDGSRPNKKLNR
jgi:hypothetical protein